MIHLRNLQEKHWLTTISFFCYKLRPKAADFRQDVEAHALVREATGPDFVLMSDPVASMNLEEAIRFGRFRKNSITTCWKNHSGKRISIVSKN